MIGKSPRRLEDRVLLTGAASFAADLSAPGQLHMRVVRSTVAFGRILEIDTSEAERAPGVVAVWTADDVREIPPIDFRQESIPGLEPYRQPVLAREVVRYVGEPLAVVFTEDSYSSEDAAELVFVDYEEGQPIVDATAAPAAFDGSLSTEPTEIRHQYGDVDGSFAEADLVVEGRFHIGRHTGVPLETRGGLALTKGDVVYLFGAAKVPHYNRSAIAKMLGRPIDSVVLKEGHVGGGFGVRGELYPEDVLLCLAALRLERPVRWIEDRREHLMTANHSRDQVHNIRAAVNSAGFILALEDEFWLDQGAYLRTHACTVPNLTAAMLPGPYEVPSYRVRGHVRLTNKTPAGTYRAPGRYEGTFARERLVDLIAGRLELDPVEVRRTNFISPGDMPHARPLVALGTPLEYDSGDYPRLLDRLLDHLSYDAVKAELRRRRAEGQLVGLGLAFFVEKSGLGPSDAVRIEVEAGGDIVVFTGAASVGQGVETSIAQICADCLETDIARIRIVHGQTDAIAHGMGAFASRVTVMTGSATHLAAEKLKSLAVETAALQLGTSPAEIHYENGVLHSPHGHLTLGELAARKRLCVEDSFETRHMAYPYGAHATVVEVDPATGGVEVLRYVVAYDVGRAINPALVEGQIVGGVAQGVGGALTEEFVYDRDGQPLATSFMDYLLPTCAEIPAVEVLISEDAPSPLNPLGCKGSGEGGTTGAGAAIAAAIDDALDMPGAVTSIPATPEEIRGIIASLATSRTSA
jgi:CO/xanthine dehydrogenase Mo-binding subunit